MLSPMTAIASLISYDYVGFDGGDGWTSSGAILINEADVTAGGDLVNSFVSWEFTWTDGIDIFSLDSSNSLVSTQLSAFFTADATSVSSAQMCLVGIGENCDTGGFPIFGIFNTDDWIASTPSGYIMNNNQFDSPGAWSVSLVPEPGTLALFGLSLAGFGWLRRKKS